MKEKYVILRKGGTFMTHGAFAGPTGTVLETMSSAPTLEVNVDEVSKKDIRALQRDKSVEGAAQIMPMKLIEPMAVTDVASPAAGGVTWGVKAVRADTSPYSGDGIIVAVLDTGIDATHPAFSGVQLVQEDFTGEGNGDTHGHGTHCAGTIFGRNVNGLRIGVAPGVKKALIGKVIGRQGASTDQLWRAIQWAVDNGANIISMSLGMDFPGYVKYLMDVENIPAEPASSRALEAYRANVLLFQDLARFINSQASFIQGTVVIAAAGNESNRPLWEIAVAPPAVATGIVSVAALGEGTGGLVVAVFSNTGAEVSAPGVGIISAKLGGGLASMDGTSMATPHVAGVAALWAEKIKKNLAITPGKLIADVVGNSSIAELATGFDAVDIGNGLVLAPQQ
ncbi:MAG TPA: S8 family serine peptidase [Desulfomonilaceae bacterium]|nr:S8 family serine peptidase [Desulfomonilaceae bacterium]